MSEQISLPSPLTTEGNLGTAVIPYEEQLNQNWEWAMQEGSRFFDESNKVHQSLKNIIARLEELNISYAIVGGMALFRYGFRRFTEDVDLLVTKSSLEIIHQELSGRGYLEPFTGSRHLRDTSTGVKIEFLVTGDYPGDGKPKSISFPNPEDVVEEYKSIKFLNLPTLINLKLASGISNENRQKDLEDVRQLILIAKLPQSYIEQLHPFVKAKYSELWLQLHGQRYYLRWRIPTLTTTPNSWSELQQALPARMAELQVMAQAGIQLDPAASKRPTDLWFATNDWQVAEQFDMHPLDEWMD
jgi:hypothetical protein